MCAMAKEIISFARANEPSPTPTWTSEWPNAISTGADGDAAPRIAWELCKIVRVHTAAPLYEVRLRAQVFGLTRCACNQSGRGRGQFCTIL
jgi:hypothetical protein